MFKFLLMDCGFSLTVLWIFRLVIIKTDWEYGISTNLTVGIWKPEVTISLGWRYKEPSLSDIDQSQNASA